MRAAVAPAWMRKNPGAPVHFALETPHGDSIRHWPGVEYYHGRPAPEAGFVNAYEESPYGNINRLFERFGLDWTDKRLYYFTTELEREYAELVWGGIRPRVLIQWNGGMDVKQYPEWPKIAAELAGGAYANIIALDCKGEAHHSTHYRIMGRGDLRKALAVVASADLFIGWDSGPFYAAIGSLVRSIGIFPWHRPEELFQPVTMPRHVAMYSPGNPTAVPAADIIAEARRLLGL